MGEPDTNGHKCPKCEHIEYSKTTYLDGVYTYTCFKCGCEWEEGS